MKAPLTRTRFRSCAGVSVVELLIGVAMLIAIAGYIFTQVVSRPKNMERTVAANEIAVHLRKAQLDSMRRRPTDIKQMAQVKLFNRQFYSVAIDGDGDGELDIPLVMTFPGDGLEISGPFPKTFIFDQSGQTVDANNHPVPAEVVVLRDSSGATAIRLSVTGQTTIVPALNQN